MSKAIDESIYTYHLNTDDDYEWQEGDEWHVTEYWHKLRKREADVCSPYLIRRKRKQRLPRQGETITVYGVTMQEAPREFICMYKGSAIVDSDGGYYAWKHWRLIPEKSPLELEIEQKREELRLLEERLKG